MIPKTIHYMWLGGELSKPQIVRDCILSWKRFCPEWEIIEWNESNLDLRINSWVKGSIEERKYGFAIDYFRWLFLADYGGVYLDTDVELVSPMDDLLNNVFFTGLESYAMVGNAVVGSERNSSISRKMKNHYSKCEFTGEPSPRVVTALLQEDFEISDTTEIQYGDKLTIYPKEFFYPKTYGYELNPECITENTKCVHHYLGSWLDNPAKNLKTYNRYDT